MNRFFFVKGTALIPARFWGFFEYNSKTEMLESLRRIKRGTIDGYIWKVPNDEVDKYSLLIMNKVKKL
jgi:hypothetical protein